MSSAVCFNLDQSKILSAGNGLRMVGKCRRIFVENEAFTDDSLYGLAVFFICLKNLGHIPGEMKTAAMINSVFVFFPKGFQ